MAKTSDLARIWSSRFVTRDNELTLSLRERSHPTNLTAILQLGVRARIDQDMQQTTSRSPERLARVCISYQFLAGRTTSEPEPAGVTANRRTPFCRARFVRCESDIR